MLRTTVVAACVLIFAACGGKKDEPKPASKGSAPVAAVAAADPQVVAFWKWFVEKADALHADADLEKTMNAISEELRKIEEGVFAEIGKDGEQLMLVITADGDTKKFPTVQRIYDARPASVNGWKIVAFRPRPAPGAAPLGIEMGGKKVEPKDVKFVAVDGEKGKLDVRLYLPMEADAQVMGQIGFLILDHTLGEYDMETRIGGVGFEPVSKAPADAKPLTALPAMVDALKARP